MNNNNQGIYKIIKDFDTNLKPYRNMPIYDENPDLGTYCSTLYAPHPKRGDCLIYNNGDITFSSVYRDFDNVYFSHKINLENLLKKQIIREISAEIYKLDFQLSSNIKEISENINCLEFGLDFIKDDKKDTKYSNEKIKEDEKKLVNLKSTLYPLKSIQFYLYRCNDPMLEKVLIKSCLKFEESLDK